MKTQPEQLQSGLVECETASEFLDHLSPWGPLFKAWQPEICSLPWFERNWIFRGQVKAGEALLPSALRPNAKLIPAQGARFASAEEGQMQATSEDWTQEKVFLSELRTVSDFCEHADRGGSPLPEDTAHTRGIRKKWVEDQEWREKQFRELKGGELRELRWPPAELESIFGVAQHYGVPTQLLDWSRNPYAAAYFALEKLMSRPDACLPTNESSRIGVWAFKEYALERANNLHALGVPMDQNPGLSFRVVVAPTATNPNLRAQQGVFIAKRFHNYSAHAPHDRRTFDSIFDEMRADPEYVKLKLSPVTKLTLPATQAPKLLALLKHVGVSGATLYPGFQGAKRGYDEAVWLDQKSGFSMRPLSGSPPE